MRTILSLSAAIVFTVVALAQAPKSTPAETEGMCTYYSRSHDGHLTASREKFSSNAMTAAHRTLPLGTKLKVTNLSNGKSVVVKVNDRGPYAKGMSLSVTRRAAQELGFIKEGKTRVKMEPVQ